jgi:hypothetical protein
MVGLSIEPVGLSTLARKKIIAALLALVVIVILGIGIYVVSQPQPENSPPPQSGGDWSPTFRQDFARTGYSTSAGPLTNQTLWVYATEMTIEYPSPAVVDSVAYFGSNDGRLYAVNASTGSKIWSYQTGNMVESSCTVVGGGSILGQMTATSTPWMQKQGANSGVSPLEVMCIRLLLLSMVWCTSAQTTTTYML